MGEDDLREYRAKRDFRKTSEPRGGESRRDGDAPRFVIQHHEASTDHYDLRLEVGGVLKSWAVPKGPSTDPSDKRLAMPTEDHPMDYRDFEGTISAGEYGAGTVLVWDTGTYENRTRHKGAEQSMSDGLERGHVSVWLHGEKLTGGYALTRFRTGKDEAWLLVKERDDRAGGGDPVRDEPDSALTGRDMEQVAEEGDRL
ncbi:MAG: DNA ligase [Streptosporangiales bacterium]|nr:DNA ligase [Streptosporangiales bacterium]